MKPRISLPTKTLAVIGTMAAIGAAPALAQGAKKPETKPPAAPKPAKVEHTVAKENLRSVVVLTGVVEAARSAEIKLDPEAWADLTVIEAAPHGTRVRKGQVLVRLDTEKLAEQIADTEEGRRAAELTLQQAVHALENLEETTPIQLAAAEKALKEADEAVVYWDKVSKDQRIKSAKNSLKFSERSLEAAEEELNQLLKMYEADDLTEETEEIIVKRARYSVESARNRLEAMQLSTEYALNTSIPREDVHIRESAKNARIAAALARQTLPKALELKKIEVANLKKADRKAREKLADLKKDLKLLDVRAPMDGIVYHGKAIGGKWATAAAVGKKLVPGGKLAAKEVFMTVVQPSPVRLRVQLKEDQLAVLRDGSSGYAAPVYNPVIKIPAKLRKIDQAPQPTGTFGATVEFGEKVEKLGRLVPGMNCKITFVPVNETGVLTVPAAAVFQDNGGSLVFRIKKDGSHETVKIKTGATDGKKVVVRSGLNEGDKVLLSHP